MLNAKNRTGEVCGVKVVCKPVPWKLARKGIAASQSGDQVATLDAMAEIVTKCVTLENGMPINADELSIEELGALGGFAIGGKGEELADFT